MSQIDPIALSRDLIRCKSVTPADAGALDVLTQALESIGFTVQRLRFDDSNTPPIDNIYARWGEQRPNFCFAGHTDVVPVGDQDAWTVDPFAATLRDDMLIGRGAADMKTAIAAFVCAAQRCIEEGSVRGSLSLLITGDEEGPAINGTKKVLQAITDQGEVIDACLIGEPTGVNMLGDMAKIGRRGSLNATLTVTGVQGHVAYPHLADNPVPKLLRLLSALSALRLDAGTDHFDPSNLEIVSVDVGNAADNVIPARATARFNTRFNDRHDFASLEALYRQTLDAVGEPYDLVFHPSGPPFISAPGKLSDCVVAAVQSVTGRVPELSTTGGTSDGRFIKDYCSSLIELGMANQTMHKVDERVPVADITALADIYTDVLRRFFAG